MASRAASRLAGLHLRQAQRRRRHVGRRPRVPPVARGCQGARPVAIDDMAHITVDYLFKFNTDYFTMAKVAVHRADGRLETFAGNFFVCDELLRYITERLPSLKSLTVISSSDVTNEALGAIVDGCPRLELLHVSDCSNISIDGVLKAKCARIATLELVPWDEDDDPYYWYCRRQDGGYWGN
uniref:Uncharacterized protein n=1 Tax=Avena sativa TaxID=4498 RepID=A0ACD5Y6E2_AVESA